MEKLSEEAKIKESKAKHVITVSASELQLALRQLALTRKAMR